MAIRVYLDESGWTGDDLLNPSQPVFAIATHCIPEDECAALKQKHFPYLQAPELKHKDLCKGAKGQRALLSALGELVEGSGEHIKVSYGHKEYAVCSKIVDYVIEPGMYVNGIDLYARRGDVGLSNLLYMTFSLDMPYRRTMLELFQRVVRSRSTEARLAFDDFIHHPHPVAPVDECRVMISSSLKYVGWDNVLENLETGALDFAFAFAYHLAGSWKKTIGPGFEVVHDESSSMAKAKDLWDALVSKDRRPARVGRGSTVVEYPLGVSSTSFISSRSSAALQIADIIAGAVTRAFTAQLADEDDPYVAGLREILVKVTPVSAVWPSLDVSGEPEPPGDGPQPEDPLTSTAEVMAEVLAKKRNG